MESLEGRAFIRFGWERELHCKVGVLQQISSLAGRVYKSGGCIEFLTLVAFLRLLKDVIGLVLKQLSVLVS